MAVIDVELAAESQTRYLTYALSVVSSRALPDVRDGLKPVQRRILYAMMHNLRLQPDKNYRKSAAVVGEVLARYHPHGDTACYDAMVRMAQDFSLRYPLVDGQGNFGSLDGDSAAAYRYTEAKLTALALEVIGDIGQETVAERDNFDQSVKEPVVLPSRVPNLLMNGSSGIAVGMATAIPPHNLVELVKGIKLLIEEPSTSVAKLLQVIKGPDFPTGCLVLNTREELKQIYSTGRGAIRMRASYRQETIEGRKQRKAIVIDSIPYAVDKSQLVEKIADLIIARKVPQIEDVRDESTDEVRVVLELAAGADEEAAMAYLFKNTPLQQNFNVNLTALVPTENPYVGRPAQLSLTEILQQFIDFRLEVVRRKLQYEKGKLEDRIHVLEGLEAIIDVLDEVIAIVRKSGGRADAAEKLQKRFKLTERQAYFIVDLRIYQLSRTSVEEVTAELAEKRARVAQIDKILKSDKALRREVSTDLDRVAEEFGDPRRSKVIGEFEEPEYDKDSFLQHEEAYVVVTKDGWLKRMRTTNDPQGTRLREGDSLAFVEAASTKDSLVIFTNRGNVFGMLVHDVPATSGFGDPVQKHFKFQDGEQIVGCIIMARDDDSAKKPPREILLFTERGYGFRYDPSQLGVTKKIGKRLVRVASDDALKGFCRVDQNLLLSVSADGYGICFAASEAPVLNNGGKGVILQKVPGDDALVSVKAVTKREKVGVEVTQGKPKEIDVAALTIGSRAKRGLKLVKRGLPVVRLIETAAASSKSGSKSSSDDGKPVNLSLF